MKLSFCAASATILFGLFGHGQGQGASNRIEGYFNFHFYDWTDDTSDAVKYHHDYPEEPITVDDINILMTEMNDFMFTATEAHQIGTFGSNNVVDSDILSVGTVSDPKCIFPSNATEDPSFWCPVTFTFFYITDIPEQEYENLTDVKDILSDHTFNRDVFASKTYLQPLSNFIDGTLHPKGGFWSNISKIGLSEGLTCEYRDHSSYRGRAMLETYPVEGEVPFEDHETVYYNKMMPYVLIQTATKADKLEEGVINSNTMTTTSASKESKGTVGMENIVGSSAPKSFSCFCITIALTAGTWFF